MSANAGSAVPISWNDLVPYFATANQHLKGISFTPKKTLENLKGSVDKPRGYVDSRDQEVKASSVSILTIAKDLNKDELLDEAINNALNALRTGLQVALYVAAKYAEASGFTTLKERAAGRIPMSAPDQAEWSAKQETHAAITAFVLARYVLWRFESKDEKKFTAEVDFAGLPEPVAIGNQIRAIGSVFYHLGSYLKTAQTPAQFHKLVFVYMGAVLKELQARSGALTYADAFLNVIYKLDATEFVIRGFQASLLEGVTELAKRIEDKDIMGNHQMKRKLRQLAMMVMAYDAKKQMNPFVELEAFTERGVLEGKPGTGKSMGLDRLATIVYDRCKALKRPFVRRPIPGDLIKSLQGETAATYMQWRAQCRDPNFICIAEVDDAEAVFLDRRQQSSSEGSKLAVQSRLRDTEGAGARTIGNLIDIDATNNLDMMDPAVISRYMFRIRVPGAETRNDFCDQLKSSGDRFNARAKREVFNLKFPGDYVFLSDQGFVSKVETERQAEKIVNFTNAKLQKIWDKVSKKRFGLDEYDLYGTFFAELHSQFEAFTSRDVRNVQLNVGARLFDIEYPMDWLDEPDRFFNQDYDVKKNMILELAISLQKGLTVGEVMFQELVNYVETTIAMLDSGRQYRINKMVDDELERREAMEIAKKRHEAELAA